MKFGFYSNRKSLKVLSKDCQRNKADHDCNPLHLYFKVNVWQVILTRNGFIEKAEESAVPA